MYDKDPAFRLYKEFSIHKIRKLTAQLFKWINYCNVSFIKNKYMGKILMIVFSELLAMNTMSLCPHLLQVCMRTWRNISTVMEMESDSTALKTHNFLKFFSNKCILYSSDILPLEIHSREIKVCSHPETCGQMFTARSVTL